MTEPSNGADLAAYSELVAAAVFIIGIVAARLASVGVAALLGALDRRLARLTTTETGAIAPRLIALSRTVVFWLILLLAVVFALRLLGVAGTGSLVNSLLGFIPQVLVGLAIVLAGHLLGLLASGLLTQFYDAIEPDSIGPRLLHGMFIVVAVVMGLQQVGVNISFITQLLLILIAMASGGLMLAFALGARQHVANLLASRELNRLSVGDRVRVGDIEGTITGIHDTGADIATEQGIVAVPGALFASSTVLRISSEQSDD